MSFGASIPVVSKMMMFLLTILATPIEKGDSIRVDRIDAGGEVHVHEIERSDDGYTIFEVEDDEKTKIATIEAGEDDGAWKITKGDDEDTVDLASMLRDIDAEKISEFDEKVLTFEEHRSVRLTRTGGLLYLTTLPAKATYYIVREE